MATATERKESRRVSGSRGTRQYYIGDAASVENDAIAAITSAAPGTWSTTLGSLSRVDRDIELIEIGDTGKYYAVVPYELPEAFPMDAGDSRYSFEIGGGTRHITQSLSTSGSYVPAAAAAIDFKGAINVTGKGEVRGVDIISGGFEFSETWVKAAADIDQAYQNTVATLADNTPVNNAAFRGYAAGEVLFLGASGSERDDGKYEITYRFRVSENQTAITVGDITVTTKDGWDYLWVYYGPVEDATAKRIVQRPLAAKVEKVYERGNFAGLEL